MNKYNYKRPLPLWLAYVMYLPILLPYWIVAAIWHLLGNLIANYGEWIKNKNHGK